MSTKRSKPLYDADDQGNETVKVAEQCSKHSAENGIPNRKINLKTMLCGPIGLCIGVFSDSFLEFFLLLGLFLAYALCPE